MVKSIRWTLQLWHAGLLTLVLIGFGAVTYFTTSGSHYRQIDADLERSAQLLARAMWIHPAAEASARGAGSAPSTRQDADRRDHEAFRRPPMVQDLPPDLAKLYGDPVVAGTPYFVIWHANRDGVSLTSRPASAAEVPDPRTELPALSRWEPGQNPQAPRFRQRGEWREVYVFGPFNIPVLVGRSIQYERAALRHLAWTLVLTGGAVLLVGLGGGWLVCTRALRPIREIAGTAQQISASNLSRRIEAAETTSELGQLAGVLNDMFARLEVAFAEHVRFTADASHELRTPLAIVHTNAEVSLARDRTPEEYRRSMEACLRASTRMKGLVDSLLLLAGVDSGRLVLAREPLDLRDVTAECISMVAPLAAGHRVTVESDLAATPMIGDRSRLAEVVMNLLTNAIRYNREGGCVRVRTATEDGQVVLTVLDNGIGVPAEHQPHLFRRFYRADAARSRAVGGSGLGLSICKSITEAHGGSIECQSTEGRGATFTVRVPGSPADVENREVSMRSEPAFILH
jgi:heavy metal sensor kinase